MKGNISTSSNTKPNRKNSSFSNIVLITLIVVLSAIIIFLAYSLYMKIQNISESKNKLGQNRPSAIIQVEVLNGCGVDGAAAKYTNYLRQKNFDVVQVGNFRSDTIEETIVIDRSGNTANAEKLALVLGIEKKNIIQQLNKEYLLDATLVIGRDYNKLKPLN